MERDIFLKFSTYYKNATTYTKVADSLDLIQDYSNYGSYI